MSNSFVTPQTVACQAPLCMGFPRQEYWRGLPFSSSRSSWPGDRTSISHISCSGRQILYHWATREAHCISWIWAVELPRRVNSNMGLSASITFRFCTPAPPHPCTAFWRCAHPFLILLTFTWLTPPHHTRLGKGRYLWPKFQIRISNSSPPWRSPQEI